MTFYSEEEKAQGLDELKNKNFFVIEEEDLDYFRQKIITGLERRVPIKALAKVIKQLDLLEDAVIVYREHRPPENE